MHTVYSDSTLRVWAYYVDGMLGLDGQDLGLRKSPSIRNAAEALSTAGEAPPRGSFHEGRQGWSRVARYCCIALNPAWSILECSFCTS
jgi:hypothetical protein